MIRDQVEAIRARNEKRKGRVRVRERSVRESEAKSGTLDVSAYTQKVTAEYERETIIDIDAILAEVAARRKDVRDILRALGDDFRVYGPDPDVTASVTVDRAKALVAEVERLRAVSDAVDSIEELHGGDPHRCSAVGVCLLGEAISVIRHRVANPADYPSHTGPALAAKIRAFNSSGEK